MAKEINCFFAPKKRFVSNVHFNKYLTDVDIKEFLENPLGANNWDMMPKDARKACFMNYKSEESLPKWNLITREGYYTSVLGGIQCHMVCGADTA